MVWKISMSEVKEYLGRSSKEKNTSREGVGGEPLETQTGFHKQRRGRTQQTEGLEMKKC